MIRVIKWNSVDIGIGGYVDEGRFKYSACPVADDKNSWMEMILWSLDACSNRSKQERFKYSNAVILKLYLRRLRIELKYCKIKYIHDIRILPNYLSFRRIIRVPRNARNEIISRIIVLWRLLFEKCQLQRKFVHPAYVCKSAKYSRGSFGALCPEFVRGGCIDPPSSKNNTLSVVCIFSLCKYS